MDNGVSFTPNKEHQEQQDITSIIIDIHNKITNIERILNERLINNSGPDKVQRPTDKESSCKDCTCEKEDPKEKT